MGGMSRNKGKVGERELAALLSELTGHAVRRRVRQHDGDSDLEGVPGWAIEVKRYASVTPALVAGWWQQAIEQARRIEAHPVLFYRADRGAWRAVWSASMHASDGHELTERDTIEADPPTWWQLAGPMTA